MWVGKSEDNLVVGVLSDLYMGSKNLTQAVKLTLSRGKCLYALSHPPASTFFVF